MAITLTERPIFIVGQERSGTTLLMVMLGCHPRIAVPEAAWWYPRFRGYLHTYGKLADTARGKGGFGSTGLTLGGTLGQTLEEVQE